MDYVNSRRIKLWGTARVVEDDSDLLEQLRDSDYKGRVARAILFSIETWDVNCPQHIHKRFPQSTIAPMIEQLKERISQLESKLVQYENADSASATL